MHWFVFLSITTFKPNYYYTHYTDLPTNTNNFNHSQNYFRQISPFYVFTQQKFIYFFSFFSCSLSSRNHIKNKFHIQEHLFPCQSHYYSSIITIILTYGGSLRDQSINIRNGSNIYQTITYTYHTT